MTHIMPLRRWLSVVMTCVFLATGLWAISLLDVTDTQSVTHYGPNTLEGYVVCCVAATCCFALSAVAVRGKVNLCFLVILWAVLVITAISTSRM